VECEILFAVLCSLLPVATCLISSVVEERTKRKRKKKGDKKRKKKIVVCGKEQDREIEAE
jgi:hypothetical protein